MACAGMQSPSASKALLSEGFKHMGVGEQPFSAGNRQPFSCSQPCVRCLHYVVSRAPSIIASSGRPWRSFITRVLRGSMW